MKALWVGDSPSNYCLEGRKGKAMAHLHRCIGKYSELVSTHENKCRCEPCLQIAAWNQEIERIRRG